MAGFKPCAVCGEPFSRRARDSAAQWAKREFCSCACSNKVKKVKPLEAAFLQHMPKGQCIEWGGTKDGHGYGTVQHNGKKWKAHRLAYFLAHGALRDDQVVRHDCDNPSCVNPAHLLSGTQAENVQDMVRRGRLNPVSQLNLRPGRQGFRGAGPQSRKELKWQAR